MIGKPTRIFLFRKIRSLMCNIKGESGIDFACGDAKNRHFFKTINYIGLDIDKKQINKLKKKKIVNCFFFLQDITKIKKKFLLGDIVLSTNTLQHLKKKQQNKAIQNLIRYVKKDGILIIDSKLDNEFNAKYKLFFKNFNEVKIIFFRNKFNFFLEKILANFKILQLIFKYSGLIIFLSYVEEITSKFKAINEAVIFVGYGKN